MTDNNEKERLYREQMKLLDTFLAHGAITPEQYKKSSGDLTAKMFPDTAPRNPWEELPLEVYEAHMSAPETLQLQLFEKIIGEQFSAFGADTVCLLGVAGGNGITGAVLPGARKIYGIDINGDYLKICAQRMAYAGDKFEAVKMDLSSPGAVLPGCGLVIADLIIEYIGEECFSGLIKRTSPEYVSCVIQINTGADFVSKSKYAGCFDGICGLHKDISEKLLGEKMRLAGYSAVSEKDYPLPTGKLMRRIDYKKSDEN